MFPITQLELRPGIIDLGWGHPDPRLLPLAAMREAAISAFDAYGAETLGYGFTNGPGPFLEWLCERIAMREGRRPSEQAIMTTGGTSLAIDQLCTLLSKPGDVVLVESPTYHLAVRILRDHPLELQPVAVDTDGLRIDVLEDILARLRKVGKHISLLYCVPTFHNPTGVSLSSERRSMLLDIAAREQFLIIEDDVYRELAFDDQPPASLWSMDRYDCVIRLGSFAKSIAPGLRLGWINGPEAIVQQLCQCGMLDSGGGINHLTAMIVYRFCASAAFERHVATLRHNYAARRAALQQALYEHIPPDCVVQAAQGGFFTWLSLPEHMSARQLLPAAEALGVSYMPGDIFHLDRSGGNTLRLAHSLYAPDDLVEAASRLGAVLKA